MRAPDLGEVIREAGNFLADQVVAVGLEPIPLREVGEGKVSSGTVGRNQLGSVEDGAVGIAQCGLIRGLRVWRTEGEAAEAPCGDEFVGGGGGEGVNKVTGDRLGKDLADLATAGSRNGVTRGPVDVSTIALSER